MSSIEIFPVSASSILNKHKAKLLFPAPVLPTTPTFSPALTSNVIFFKDGSSSGRYFAENSTNFMFPFSGQFSLGLLVSTIQSAFFSGIFNF
jgi:hypothetical protein